MKKGIILLMVAFISLLASVSVSADEDINVMINGTAVNFDTPARIINGRTMVPVRAIFEALGAEVSWDAQTNTVTAENDIKKITMTIGVNYITDGELYIIMDTAPVIIDSRTYIPARFAAEAFGNSVGWDEEKRTVHILTDIKKNIQYYEKYKNNTVSLMYPKGWYVDEEYIGQSIIFIDNQGESYKDKGMCMIVISGIEYSGLSFSDTVAARYDYLLSNDNIKISEFKNTAVNGLNAAEFKYEDNEGDYVISYFIEGNRKIYDISFVEENKGAFDNLYSHILSTFTLL